MNLEDGIPEDEDAMTAVGEAWVSSRAKRAVLMSRFSGPF